MNIVALDVAHLLSQMRIGLALIVGIKKLNISMEVYMQRVEREIPKNCEIVFWGDTHGGSTLTHYNGIQMIIDYIVSKKIATGRIWETG